MKNIQHFSDLENFLLDRNLNNIWDFQNDFKIGLSYSVGLIISNEKPCFKAIMANTGIKAINISDFTRKDLRYWQLELLFQKEVELLEDGGEILLDEVIHPKENTVNMDAHYVHCSSQKKNIKGTGILSIGLD